MKMRKYLRIITLTLLVTGIIFGCKKDSTSKPNCRIITASSTGTGASQFNFTYNSAGELIFVSSGPSTTSIAHSGNTVITISENGGVFTDKRIVTLNSNGLASNIRIENDETGTSWTNYTYEYSGTDVIKDTYTSSMGGAPEITTYTWSGGNLMTASGASTATFSYYTDKPAQGDYLFLSQLVNGYQVIRNKNAAKSFLSGSAIFNFDYTTDTDEKISSIIVTGSSPTTLTYQYQCN